MTIRIFAYSESNQCSWWLHKIGSLLELKICQHCMNNNEIVIPKKRSSEILTVSFAFVSFPYWFHENQHLEDLTCFCFISVSVYIYVTQVSIWNLAAIYTNINLYVVFLLLVGPEKPEQHKPCLLHWCHDEEATEEQKTFETSSWEISDCW